MFCFLWKLFFVLCVILKSSYKFLLNSREVILYSLLVLMGKVRNIFNIYFIAFKMKITLVFSWDICDCIFVYVL